MTKSKKRNQKTGKFAHRPQAYGSSMNSDNKIVKQTIHGADSYTTTGGGVINTAVALDPATLPGTDWADFSSTYDEFRVIGFRVHIICRIPNATSANNFAIALFDNDSTATIGSYSDARQFGNSKCFSTIMQHPRGAPLTYTWWRPTAGAETTVTWCDVATPSTSLGAFKLYVDGLAASTAYFTINYDFYVEFRGRR